MSISFYRGKIESLTKAKARYDKELSQLNDDMARLTRDIGSIQRSITRTTGLSTLQSKQRQIESKQRQLVQKQRKAADVQGKISRVVTDLTSATNSLERLQRQEQQKLEREGKRRRDTEIKHTKALTQELQEQARLHAELARSSLVIDVTSLPERITVVFFAPNPQDQTRLGLDEEVRAIEAKLRASDYRDSIEFRAKWAVRPDDLLQALNEHHPHIVHFSGHGDESGIAFVDPDGNTKLVSTQAIVQLMAAMTDNIRVVVFNTCLSAEQAKAVTEHIDITIGMKASIDDEAARIFAAHFYSAIGFGRSVQDAFKQGLAALAVNGLPDVDTPEMYTAENVDPQAVVLVKPSIEL